VRHSAAVEAFLELRRYRLVQVGPHGGAERLRLVVESKVHGPHRSRPMGHRRTKLLLSDLRVYISIGSVDDVDLSLSAEQRQLVDAFTSLYSRMCGPEAVREAEPLGFDGE